MFLAENKKELQKSYTRGWALSERARKLKKKKKRYETSHSEHAPKIRVKKNELGNLLFSHQIKKKKTLFFICSYSFFNFYFSKNIKKCYQQGKVKRTGKKKTR